MEPDRKPSRMRIWTIMAVVAVAAIASWGYLDQAPRWWNWWENRHVAAALEANVPVNLPAGSPLGAVVKFAKASSVTAALPSGIPVYIDPIGLTEAGATMTDPITIPPGTMPLKTAIEAALGPLGLSYVVKNGLLTITSKASARYRLSGNPSSP